MAQYYDARLNSKGQLQIPAEVRKKFNMQTWQFQELEVTLDSIIVHPAPDADKVRAELKANLHKKGFSDKKLREMAEAQNGKIN